MKRALRIPKYFLISLIGLGILFIFGWLWLRQIQTKSLQIEQELENRIKEVQSLQSTNKISLTSTQVVLLKAQQAEIKKNYEKLVNLLDTSKLPSQNLSPLEFKESLLETQKQLIEKASLWNIQIPNAIGFFEFEGGNIPVPQDVPKLVQQLDALQVLIDYAIESRIYKIARIDKKEIQDITLSADQMMYQTLPFELSLRCSMQSLADFLNRLYASNHFFIIRSINMQSAEGSLSVEFVIDAIKLKKEQSEKPAA